MKVSVITPSYNQGAFIDKCITSVKAQKRSEVEHIILDNCSDDATRQHLLDYQNDAEHVDLKVLIEKDNGQTSAINKGYAISSGDIVCWLNTDEFYEEDTLFQVCSYFEQHPEVDLLFGDVTFVDTLGRCVRKKREYTYNRNMLLYYGCFIPSCATFMRRRILEDGHFLDESFRVTMDFEFYVRLAQAGYRFAHLSSNLAFFTWHECNISANQVARRRVERRMVQNRFTGLRLPRVFRPCVFEALRYFWISRRILQRWQNR